MNKLETAKEKELILEIAELTAQLNDLQASRRITCPACKKQTPLLKAILIEHYSYVPPSGCTEGDYHTLSEHEFYCGKCKTYNRAYVGRWDLKDRYGKVELDNIEPDRMKEPRVPLFFFIKKYKQYFGMILKSYNSKKTIEELQEDHKEQEKEHEKELYRYC